MKKKSLLFAFLAGIFIFPVAVSAADQSAVTEALTIAGPNATEWISLLEVVVPEEKPSAVFLLANMPQRDLVSLKKDFLLENIYLARQAAQEVPWGKEIPEEIFLNYVLPYAHVNERRDNWRRDFYDRFIDVAKEAGTIDRAAVILNKKVFEDVDVSYHATKRPKPDQSPYESMEAHYASCTGLSILYADALRAVGIPARLALIPQWKDQSGNHTWVEIWDGDWKLMGASESEEIGTAWFSTQRHNVDPEYPEHCIYAVSFEKTDLRLPLVWDLSIDYVYGMDVTGRYLSLFSDE